MIACMLAAGAAVASPKQRTSAKHACEGMTPAQCVDAALPCEYGIDAAGKPAKKDPARAAAMYRSACDAKLAVACFSLANMGSRARLDAAAALALYRRACELDAAHCLSLAYELRDRDDAASRTEAKKILTKLCNGKHADACYALGDMSPRGKERVVWYRRACDGGRDEGCTRLAQIYSNDEDPSADAAASTRALEAMCNAGNATACNFAADRHFSCKGTNDSGHAGADPWLIKACDLGDVHTCAARGRGMLVDAKTAAQRATAIRMLKKGCDAGEPSACDWLARAKR